MAVAILAGSIAVAGLTVIASGVRAAGLIHRAAGR